MALIMVMNDKRHAKAKGKAQGPAKSKAKANAKPRQKAKPRPALSIIYIDLITNYLAANSVANNSDCI